MYKYSTRYTSSYLKLMEECKSFEEKSLYCALAKLAEEDIFTSMAVMAAKEWEKEQIKRRQNDLAI